MITSHEFWITRDPESACARHDEESVPYFGRFGRDNNVRDSILDASTDDWSIQIQHAESVTVSINLKRVPVALRFVELVDDRRTLGEIVEAIATEFTAPRDEVAAMCRHVVDILAKHDMLVTRHVSVPRVPRA